MCFQLSIPLPSYDMADFVAWNLTKTGAFSVRSAYYAVWKDKYGSRAATDRPSTANINPIWDVVWKLGCPTKVKNFSLESSSWHPAMPCTLGDRHMKVNTKCLACVLRERQTYAFSNVRKQDRSDWVWGWKMSLSELVKWIMNISFAFLQMKHVSSGKVDQTI